MEEKFTEEKRRFVRGEVFQVGRKYHNRVKKKKDLLKKTTPSKVVTINGKKFELVFQGIGLTESGWQKVEQGIKEIDTAKPVTFLDPEVLQRAKGICGLV